MDEELMLAAFGAAFFHGMGAMVFLRPAARGTGKLLGVLLQASREGIRLPHPGTGVDPDLADPLEKRLRRVEHRLAFTEELLFAPRRERSDALVPGSAREADR